ncbi:tRNA pseudouridine(13) synthase TruD [Shewanella yunxiaonensis]|uniref:tRNA pseudouridine synthase D n=1 Tax=Shewanella yunxiaonensis TaxID=2829809 RepID=A0ABX7YPY2_9GAMM|nr:tRNA pseudouridine(13) synthase TruD [Shewanella yunxiaonensis]QUN04830.1 tRNA pseudouridine(13) synthase TruD [Shewanella yunxiaonensis]
MVELHYLYGKPHSCGNLRTYNEDFLVQELLPFAPTGEGEHHLLHIRKSGLNTAAVAEMLAKFAGVHPKEVTFAGQKDKNAVTEQWFGIRIPGKETPDWQQLNADNLQVLASHRHSKKLRIGALTGNRFTLILRELSDPDDVQKRLQQIREHGVPNYFGEQRFGHQGGNITKAREMLAGRKVKDRNKRSLYLSALRSMLFNAVTSTRLSQHSQALLAGDCVMLAGSNSFFVAEQWDEVLKRRLAEQDIQLSAPLWGRGTPLCTGDALAFESRVLEAYADDLKGLEDVGLSQERRPLFLCPQAMSWSLIPEGLKVSFVLPAGAYATSVLREVLDYTDVAEMRWQQAVAEKEANQGG